MLIHYFRVIPPAFILPDGNTFTSEKSWQRRDKKYPSCKHPQALRTMMQCYPLELSPRWIPHSCLIEMKGIITFQGGERFLTLKTMTQKNKLNEAHYCSIISAVLMALGHDDGYMNTKKKSALLLFRVTVPNISWEDRGEAVGTAGAWSRLYKGQTKQKCTKHVITPQSPLSFFFSFVFKHGIRNFHEG